MKKRYIKKAAVLGSGVMGSRIACHLANAGVEVLLLDIVSKEAKDSDKLNLRNKIVNDSLQSVLKSNPSPIYLKSFTSRISTGNFDDDFEKIKDADWVIEAVIENLDIKKQVFEKVEQYRKPNSIISTNTSGIPIHMMLDGRSDDFKSNFCGTHFFNPPRYLPLLEIIPTKYTSSEIIDFLQDYGQRFLGKTTVVCKDTPAFIANRVGVYAIMELFHVVDELGLTVEQVDKLTGKAIGRQKSATFRTCDVVGLDTLAKVANGLRANCKDDEANDKFELPSYINKMVENNWLGSKSGQGFYKKVKTEDGKSEILSLDLKTLEYKSQGRVNFPALEISKTIENLNDRIKTLFNYKGIEGDFYRKTWLGLFAYISNRIPEITDKLYKVDDAIKAGFGWQIGPFEMWDAIGIGKTIEHLEQNGNDVSEWVKQMLSDGFESFYKVENGIKYYYDIDSKDYQKVPGLDNLISISTLKHDNVIWQNSGCSLIDIGDGILNLEFHTKMNTIGGEIINGINKSLDIVEADYSGLILSNEAEHFSAGANVGMMFMLAVEQEYEELSMAVKSFQDTMMRMKYSAVPVFAAPHNLVLGGACEVMMHTNKVIAHAETYIGLVEVGVGLLPGGGGTKEFALRASDEYNNGPRLDVFRNRFLTIGQAKVSTSAAEAFELGYLRKGVDEWVISRQHQLKYAKNNMLNMLEKGYQKPIRRKDIQVLGSEALGIVYAGANSMHSSNYITEHDLFISKKLGYVMAGGDLSQPTLVDEQYILDLERKAFVELTTQKKTLERMQSIMKTGKVLRN